MFTEYSKAQKLCAYGITAGLFGIDFMALIKVILDRDVPSLSIGISIISIILLFLSCSIITYPKFNFAFICIILYSFYTLFMAIIGNASWTESGYGVIYQLFYLTLIILLWGNKSVFCPELIYKLFFYTISIMNVTAAFLILKNYLNTGTLFFNGLGSIVDGKNVITRASTGVIGFNGVALLLSMKGKTKHKFLTCFLWICSIFVLISSNRRSENISAIAILILSIMMKDKVGIEKSTLIRRTLYFAVFFTIIVYIYNTIPVVQEFFLYSINSLK